VYLLQRLLTFGRRIHSLCTSQGFCHGPDDSSRTLGQLGSSGSARSISQARRYKIPRTIYCSQHNDIHTFEDIFKAQIQGKPLPKSHPLAKFSISINVDNLLVIQIRIRDHRLSQSPRCLIPLFLTSYLVKLLVDTCHKIYLHPETSTLLSILGYS